MFTAKTSLRRRFASTGVATAIAAGLLAIAPAAPAGAATQADEGGKADARMIKFLDGARKALGETNDTPGPIEPMIIGGGKASIKQYPYVAQLWWFDGRGNASFCTSSIVGRKKVLTAAHCTDGRNMRTRVSGNKLVGGVVIVGASKRYDGSLHGGSAMWVTKQWQHKKYNKSKIDNDVAVLTLKKSVASKRVIKIASSTEKTRYKSGTKALALGWGRTKSTSNALSPYLKKATLPINKNSTCSSVWGRNFIKGHMICVGKKATGSDRTTVATCNGDSGGPLVVRGRVVGVTSWGVKNCVARGALPVYAKVSTYSKLIAAQLR
ncbi:S1 family peptidase [Streptomyces sp. NPDC006879]|uniref:S1 family peptidase n=1 Tax=Streptomyces sp. NPDC006879 TaxID=3364767 RepID=UPI0036CBDC10